MCSHKQPFGYNLWTQNCKNEYHINVIQSKGVDDRHKQIISMIMTEVYLQINYFYNPVSVNSHATPTKNNNINVTLYNEDISVE